MTTPYAFATGGAVSLVPSNAESYQGLAFFVPSLDNIAYINVAAQCNDGTPGQGLKMTLVNSRTRSIIAGPMTIYSSSLEITRLSPLVSTSVTGGDLLVLLVESEKGGQIGPLSITQRVVKKGWFEY
jgi:hypothetical protein